MLNNFLNCAVGKIIIKNFIAGNGSGIKDAPLKIKNFQL